MRDIGLAGVGVPPMTGYRHLMVIALASLWVPTAMLARAEEPYTEEGDRLVREIVTKVRATAEESRRARLSDGVRRAMAEVPRHRFLPPSLIEAAYLDRPLLAPGGRIVIPVGPRDGEQELLVVTKAPDGRTVTRKTVVVRFVPLTR